MGLKQIIKESKILASGAIDMELVLPGEPMIYSIKYNIGSRRHSVQFFRNEKWKSLLKCFFRSYYSTKTPVVLIVRFYVSPPGSVKIRASDLKKESIPAVKSFEMCDYLLSFLEMLHHVLVNSYRQFVKIDAEKYYSDNPRTVFQFMKWDHYDKLQNNNTIHTEGQGICASGKVRSLQSKRKKHVHNAGLCAQATGEESKVDGAFVFGTPLSDCALSNPVPEDIATKET